MTKYEIMFILTTQISDEEKKACVETVETLLTQNEATEVSTEIMGERKLAYPIKKKRKWLLCFNKFCYGWNKIN